MEEKLMKNEEIRDINDKNISKHQFIAFFQFIFRIGFREEKRTTKRGKASKKRKDKERQRKQGSSKDMLNQAASTGILASKKLQV